MEVMHKVDRSGGLKGSAGKTNSQKEREWVQWSAKEKNGKAGRPRGICTRRTTAGELEQSGVGEKESEGGLLYHGEAETISAVAAPAKVSASRCVGKIESQLQQMLQLRREMLA
ncbi:hypothetical protein O181_112341 [Austropuccinia psidii MF-1]|uniref:Uncharacterized protein n=1 Tax=Austropuccinia psidii MF-1 TaxID=1389203 RepID=A0A9Q3K293_9BASI|nr:hypothetical protein [Austropuccinia psidii MF-1]